MTTQTKIQTVLDTIEASIENWPTSDTNVQEYARNIWSKFILPNKEYNNLLKTMNTDFWGLFYPIFMRIEPPTQQKCPETTNIDGAILFTPHHQNTLYGQCNGYK